LHCFITAHMAEKYICQHSYDALIRRQTQRKTNIAPFFIGFHSPGKPGKLLEIFSS